MLPLAITDWIRSIIIYMLLVSVLLHLLPDESYRKYVRLAVGLLLLLIVMEPVSRWLSDGSIIDFLTEELPEGTWSEQEEMFRQEAEAAQEQALCEAYEEQLREMVAQYVQVQGYILRETEIDVTADGVQKLKLQVAANPDAEDEGGKQTAAAVNARDTKAMTEQLQADLCEQFALKEQAVSVTIRIE